MGAEDEMASQQSHDQTGSEQGWLRRDEPRMWFLERASAPGEDAVKIVERTRTLEYAITLVDKAAAGVERIDFHLERLSMVGKMATEKLLLKGRPDPCGEPHCFLI